MADTWTRSERPDGHRSLWYHMDRWYTVSGDANPYVRLEARGGGAVTEDVRWLGEECARHHIPTPTAEDLAWLRGTS